MKIRTLIASSLCAAAMIACSGPKTTEVEAYWLPDREPSNNNVSLFGEVPQGIIDSLGIQNGIPASMSSVLVKVDGMPILFDTGMGADGAFLLPSLEGNGVEPSEIEHIYLTHLHGDHIGGLMNPENFPNAKIWMSKAEYEGWKNMESGNAQQLQLFEMYADRINLFEFGDVLDGGVATFDAKGHTPGHTVYQVGNYLIVGDLMHGVALQMAYPEYSARFDQDQENSVANRKKYIQYAKDNGLTMVGMHFPAPGFVD